MTGPCSRVRMLSIKAFNHDYGFLGSDEFWLIRICLIFMLNSVLLILYLQNYSSMWIFRDSYNPPRWVFSWDSSKFSNFWFLHLIFDLVYTHQNFQKCLLEQTHQNKLLQVSLHFVYLKFTTYIHCICYIYTCFLIFD
jgi:hypothetical protein